MKNKTDIEKIDIEKIDIEKTDITRQKRYEYLDVLRGITLLSMIGYHAMWDLVYIAGVRADWYRSWAAYVWQQSICWTFILLAGFCWSLGRNKWKKGCIVFGAGILVSIVTLVVTPGERVVFGVLTLLGSCMLLMIPLEKIMRRIPSVVGLVSAMVLFLFTKSINHEYLGIGDWELIPLPADWFRKGYFMTYLGFTDRGFYSTDYFSLLPWIFLFFTGYFLYRVLSERGLLEAKPFISIRNAPLAFVGRHSLLIYLLHQPVIYALVMIYKVIAIPR